MGGLLSKELKDTNLEIQLIISDFEDVKGGNAEKNKKIFQKKRV